jgi:hypothetical protein
MRINLTWGSSFPNLEVPGTHSEWTFGLKLSVACIIHNGPACFMFPVRVGAVDLMSIWFLVTLLYGIRIHPAGTSVEAGVLTAFQWGPFWKF